MKPFAHQTSMKVKLDLTQWSQNWTIQNETSLYALNWLGISETGLRCPREAPRQSKKTHLDTQYYLEMQKKINLLTHWHALKMFVSKVMIEIVYGVFLKVFLRRFYIYSRLKIMQNLLTSNATFFSFPNFPNLFSWDCFEEKTLHCWK